MANHVLIGTSWKMNLTATEADGWFRTVVRLVADVDGRQLFVLPPFTAVWVARERLTGTRIGWGAQDVSPDEDGAHTGDVSARMLADLGCRYVEVGHSERRRDYGETTALIARKVAAVVRWGMRPVLCIGERERAAPERVRESLLADLAGCLEHLGPTEAGALIVAYEPVWAIGQGAQAAPPDHVETVHAALHAWLQGWSHGASVPVIYGGSVAEDEAAGLLALPDVDGLFIGRHALDPHEFARLAHAGLDRPVAAVGRQEGAP
jgi:triosephosphate isomerase (TIM)